MFNNIYYINQGAAGEEFNAIIAEMKVKDGADFATNTYEVRIGGALTDDYYVYTITGEVLEQIMYGDANGDKNILTTDAILVLQHIANSSVVVQKGADANGDGSILTTDAILILQKIADDSVVMGPKK